MKNRDEQYNLIKLIRKVLLKEKNLEIKTLTNLNNMMGCLELYCKQHEYSLKHCQ